MNNIKDSGQKRSPAIRLKIVAQADRRIPFWNVYSKTFQMIYDTPIKKLKISWRLEKQYTSPITLEGRHNKCLRITLKLAGYKNGRRQIWCECFTFLSEMLSLTVCLEATFLRSLTVLSFSRTASTLREVVVSSGVAWVMRKWVNTRRDSSCTWKPFFLMCWFTTFRYWKKEDGTGDMHTRMQNKENCYNNRNMNTEHYIRQTKAKKIPMSNIGQDDQTLQKTWKI